MRDFCGGGYVDINNFDKIKFFNIANQNINYSLVQHSKSCYNHWSSNPGLKYKNSLITNTEICLNRTPSGFSHEHCIGCLYRKKGYTLVSLYDNGFVGHLGHAKNDNIYNKSILKENPNLILNRLNKLIPTEDNWFLRENNCTYIQRNNLNTDLDLNYSI